MPRTGIEDYPRYYVKTGWIANICRNEEIDPDAEYCWKSLAIGYALGKGLDIVDARALVSELLREDLL